LRVETPELGNTQESINSRSVIGKLLFRLNFELKDGQKAIISVRDGDNFVLLA
jgi:hypothetical protein